MKLIDVKLNRLLKQAVQRIRRVLRPSLHRPDGRFHFVVLGTEYGAWPVLEGSLSPDSVVYCFGVGCDISFDLAVIEQFGCRIDAFDPTPRCIAWLSEQELPHDFRFHKIGLSDRKQILSFSAPANKGFVSYTTAEREDSPEVVKLPVEPLDLIMAKLGHTRLDFVKLDIEGSEYCVVADIVSKRILPDQLCIEFHHGLFGYTAEDTKMAVALLHGVGYLLHYVSMNGHEYGFHLAKNTDGSIVDQS